MPGATWLAQSMPRAPLVEAQQDVDVVVERRPCDEARAGRRQSSRSFEPGDEARRGCRRACRCRRRSRRRRSAPDRCARPPASGPVFSSGVVSQSCGTRPGRRGSRRARPLRPSRAPAAPSDSRCSCGSARTRAPAASRERRRASCASASGRGQRLVADHVDAGFEERLGDGAVQVVRRDDRDHLDAVRPRAPRARAISSKSP